MPQEEKVDKSRGWQVLRRIVDATSQTQVAKDTGVNQSQISQILALQRLPGRRAANDLAKIGIAQVWWDEPPLAERESEPPPAPKRTESGEHGAVDAPLATGTDDSEDR